MSSLLKDLIKDGTVVDVYYNGGSLQNIVIVDADENFIKYVVDGKDRFQLIADITRIFEQ